MTSALASGPRELPPGIVWWCLAALAAVATARLTMESTQLGATFTLVVLTVGLYVHNRAAGLTLMWLVWLLAPFLRRVLLLSEDLQTAEPLALAPFLVTAAIVALELAQAEFSVRVRRLLILVTAAYALGLPMGLRLAPSAAAFAFFAYMTAVGCFVIGYREAEQRRLVLPILLMLVAPILSIYAITQYYLPLPEWDYVWRQSVEFNSIGSPEEGRIRVWSTLNSPGTFALVLGVAALALVLWRRITPFNLVGAGLVFAALALTYVRSVWVAIVLAFLIVVAATRGAALKRVAAVLVVLVALAPVVLTGSTGAALGERFDTLGSVEQDESAQDRQARVGLLPKALSDPLGSGLGTAGEATRLNNNVGVRYTDNGYLSLAIQLGPVGFLVVVSVILAAVAAAWRNAWRHGRSTDVLVLGVVGFLFLSLLAGDHLYGIGGMIFWYTSGLAMRRRELYERAAA
jgi:hypothetical protein